MFHKLLMCLWIVLFASSAKADEALKLEFSVEFDENGNVILMGPTGAEKEASSIEGMKSLEGNIIEDKGFSGFEDITSIKQRLTEYDGYNVRDANGDVALIMVPAGQAPALWTNEKNTFGLAQVPDGVVKASMLGSTREAAQEILRQLSEAAYAEYCSNSIRPNEFSVEVTMGAELFIKGSATLSAKFITADMCKD